MRHQGSRIIDALTFHLGVHRFMVKRSRGASPIFLDEEGGEDAPAEVYTRRRNRNRIVFGWYGGKFSHLDWLLPLLPPCHHYCEPFAGSGAVLLNRAPSAVETYNDIDGDVVNFFRVLRDQHCNASVPMCCWWKLCAS
jgi:DNA adenine methylase